MPLYLFWDAIFSQTTPLQISGKGAEGGEEHPGIQQVELSPMRWF